MNPLSHAHWPHEICTLIWALRGHRQQHHTHNRNVKNSLTLSPQARPRLFSLYPFMKAKSQNRHLVALSTGCLPTRSQTKPPQTSISRPAMVTVVLGLPLPLQPRLTDSSGKSTVHVKLHATLSHVKLVTSFRIVSTRPKSRPLCEEAAVLDVTQTGLNHPKKPFPRSLQPCLPGRSSS